MSQENHRTLLTNPGNNIKHAQLEKTEYVPISEITHIHNTLYHLPFYRGCSYLICRFGLRLTQNKATSAFIITKLSRLRDRTQEQLLAMHLRETQVQGEVEIEHVALIDTCEHAHTETQTHTDKHAHKNIPAWAPSPLIPS